MSKMVKTKPSNCSDDTGQGFRQKKVPDGVQTCKRARSQPEVIANEALLSTKGAVKGDSSPKQKQKRLKGKGDQVAKKLDFNKNPKCKPGRSNDNVD